MLLGLHQEAWRWGAVPEAKVLGIAQMQIRAETQ